MSVFEQNGNMRQTDRQTVVEQRERSKTRRAVEQEEEGSCH